MSEPTTAIHCPTHGESHATFVCVHLATSDGRGFYYAASPDDPRPDAWCYDCDLGLLKEGEWTERLEEAAQITILCTGCYDTVRERNQVVRPNFEIDGWKLGDVSDLHPPIPIQELPTQKEKRRLRPGDLVKLLFFILEAENKSRYRGERMWVRILRKTHEGFVGELDNDPRTKGTLEAGQIVFFLEDQILAIYK
jgi:hypothetical protein